MKIKIISCSDPLIKQDGHRWYKKHIGEIFEVKYFSYYVPMYDVVQYILPDGRCIAMQDVEEVKETKMKVVEKKEDSLYPCLKIGKFGGIVLFTNSNTGTVVKSVLSTYPLGYWTDNWNANSFTLYTGTLEISNGD